MSMILLCCFFNKVVRALARREKECTVTIEMDEECWHTAGGLGRDRNTSLEDTYQLPAFTRAALSSGRVCSEGVGVLDVATGSLQTAMVVDGSDAPERRDKFTMERVLFCSSASSTRSPRTTCCLDVFYFSMYYFGRRFASLATFRPTASCPARGHLLKYDAVKTFFCEKSSATHVHSAVFVEVSLAPVKLPGRRPIRARFPWAHSPHMDAG